MTPSASIVIPTRARPDYLRVALASIAPQAHDAGVELLVVEDDAPSSETRALAARFGARYLSLERPLGLNAARNAGIDHTSGELVVFVDDDVEVRPRWLVALLTAAHGHPSAQVFAGAIHPRLEGRRGWSMRSCGREGPPITALDLGDRDTDRVRFAWGANMAVRRAALARVGPFDTSLDGCGDEQEWQERLFAHPSNGHQPILYVAAAALDHRRAPGDARLAPLARATRRRGRASRRYDAWRGGAPGLGHELRTLAGCVGHVVRRRCPAGVTMVAHSLGRVEQAIGERRRPTRAPTDDPPDGDPPACDPPPDDFLSGESGTVGGLDGVRRAALDRLVDARELLTGRHRRLTRAARRAPARRRVLVLGVERPERRALASAIRAELARSRHAVEVHLAPPGERGKFENLNRLLAAHPAEGHDWLLAIDDDVVLPHGFLDNLLFLAERFQLQLAQPAHRARSHAAWRITRRQAGVVARQTPFVEIGPVTAFARATFPALLPFPEVRMGWGLDLHWAALAREHGWRCGVLDAVAILHAAAPAGDAYSRAAAVAEARALLAERPRLTAAEAQTTLLTHNRW
ncbi:MAG TPA: glycosyltransferase family 2 protein [Solirubrobacteraceae bacterium]|nr:glycosyltransferase family 2 protein [Solirubrobacteraceae bacterium]